MAMSYLKSNKRMGKDPVSRLLGKTDAAAITGTGADLRKLHNKEAGKLLREKFKMEQEMIDKLDRWERIGVLRQLSNEAVAKGIDPEVRPLCLPSARGPAPVPEGLGACAERKGLTRRATWQRQQLITQHHDTLHQRLFRRWHSRYSQRPHSVQGLGNMFARNVKVSMDEMRNKQFDAATVVLRRQLAFLRTGALPSPGDKDTATAPVGNVEEHLDEQSVAMRSLPEHDGDADEAGTPGQLRLRRTITTKVPGGRTTSRTIYITNRDDIFALNGLCEKWVRTAPLRRSRHGCGPERPSCVLP